MQFFKPAALLLAVVVGLLDTSAAQDLALAVGQIGTDAVSTAATTSQLADSARDLLARVGGSGGNIQEAVQRITQEAADNIAASNQMNGHLQSLIDDINQAFTNSEGQVTSIFGGRNLRTEDSNK